MFRSSLIFPFVVVIIFTVVLADDPKPSPAAEITTEGTGQATVSTAQPPSGSPTPTTTESNKKDVKKENDCDFYFLFKIFCDHFDSSKSDADHPKNDWLSWLFPSWR